MSEREDRSAVDEQLLRQVFLDARTHNGWRDRPVDDVLLRRVYDLARMAPTSANMQPMRLVFVRSHEAKEKLRPALAAGNVEKTVNAPVTAIVAYDTEFHEKMPTLFPARPEMKEYFGALPAAARDFVLLQNASLQAGYLMLAARSLGLDCGPMAGLDRAQVAAASFADVPWKSILLVNLGYGDPARLHPRNPRLDFDEACRIA